MRRFLMVFLVLLVVLALALPWLVGLGVQERFEELTAEDSRIVGRQPDEGRFSRGWFSSDLAVELVDGGADPWVYRTRIAHGPFTGWPPQWVRAKGSLQTGAGEFAVGWRIAPAGVFAGQLHLSADLGEGSLSFQASGEDTLVRLQDLNLPPLLGANGQVDIRQAGPDVLEWSAQLTARGLALPAAVAVDALALDGQGRRQGETLAVILELAAERLLLADMALEQPRIHLDLASLHLPTLLQVARSLDKLEAAGDPARLRNVLVTALAPLLYQQPEIRALRVAAAGDMGAFEAQLSARFTQRPPAGFVSDFGRLLNVLELDGRGRLDRGVVEWWAARHVRGEYPGLFDPAQYNELAQRYIARLLAERVLVAEPDGYRFELDYRPGRLVLNERPRSLPDLR